MLQSFVGDACAQKTSSFDSALPSTTPFHLSGWPHKSGKYDAGRLPQRILRAIALVYEGNEFRTLHITSRQVLATLIRFALNQADPSAFAFLKRATIADHLAISEATVYRALGTLERAGLIEREMQQRTRTKLRVVGRIAFTRKLLSCIGMTSRQLGDADRDEVDPDKSRLSSASLASMHDVNNPKQSSTKKHPQGKPFLRINDRAVPSDLAPLVQDQDLKVSGLFLLMRLARKAGHRLSDVVSAAGHALRPLRGRELFAYIKALLEKPIDFGHVARGRRVQEYEIHVSKLSAELEQRQIAELVERYRGKRVSSPCGRIFEVDSASVLITDADGIRRSLGHARAHGWLLEIDRAAAHPVESRAKPQPRSSSDIAHSAIEHLRSFVRARVQFRHPRLTTD